MQCEAVYPSREATTGEGKVGPYCILRLSGWKLLINAVQQNVSRAYSQPPGGSKRPGVLATHKSRLVHLFRAQFEVVEAQFLICDDGGSSVEGTRYYRIRPDASHPADRQRFKMTCWEFFFVLFCCFIHQHHAYEQRPANAEFYFYKQLSLLGKSLVVF